LNTSAYHEPIHFSQGLEFWFQCYYDSGSYIPDHWHDAIEIIYVTSGEGQATIEKKTTLFGPDEFFLINPNVIHSTATIHGDYNILIHLPMPFLLKLIPNIGQYQFHVPVDSDDPLVCQRVQALKNIMQAMKTALDEAAEDMNLQLYRLAMELVDGLYHKFSSQVSYSSKRTLDLERMLEIEKYTQKHYNRPISLREISSVVSLQPEYFCRFFKKCTGSTYLEYLNEIRLSRIYSDLINTSLPIHIILEKHGFTNYKRCHRIFAEKLNDTPRAVRKKSQGRMNKFIPSPK